MELVCEPAFDYGQAPAEWALVGDDRHAADATGAGTTIRLQTNLGLGVGEEPGFRARHVLEAGERPTARSRGTGSRLASRMSRKPPLGSQPTRFWRAWLGRARIPDHRFRIRFSTRRSQSRAHLHADRSDGGGARAHRCRRRPAARRNWDYRYTWIRDTTFTLQALHMLNLDWEADEFMQFIADVEPTEDGSCRSCMGSTVAAT